MGLLIQLFNAALTYPIVNVLLALDHVLDDFALAIIILTCIIFLITFPFMRRQLKMNRAKQALQPQIDEINRRYANDPLARAEAQQTLLKQHGLSPASSLGPTIIQTFMLSGVFFALNTVLRNSTLSALNKIVYPFLPHFANMPDMSLNWFIIFNAAWHISLGYPDPTHILPILTGIVTFVQMRMAQPVNVTQARDAVQQASQVMQWIVPLIGVAITIVFAWQFAAGVALYRLVFLLLNMAQQYFVTGWGSLWVKPAFMGSSVASARQNVHGLQRSSSFSRRSGRGKGGSARRRGRKPRKH